MNERIKELAEQCVFSEPLFISFDTDKFAELIIQKCISKIALVGISGFDNEDIGWAVQTAITSIEEHFGVDK